MWDCILSICRYKYKNVYYGDYSMDQYYDMNIIKVLIKRKQNDLVIKKLNMLGMRRTNYIYMIVETACHSKNIDLLKMIFGLYSCDIKTMINIEYYASTWYMMLHILKHQNNKEVYYYLADALFNL